MLRFCICLCINSLGSHPDEMIEDYLNGIEYLENVGEEKVWYRYTFRSR